MEENRKQRIYKVIMLVILTAVVTFIITTIIMYQIFSTKQLVGNLKVTDTSTSNTSALAATLKNFRTLLDKKYLGEIDEQKLTEGAIKGYIEGLDDPYSEYFTKEEMKDFEETTMGNYVGIGIYMVKNTKDNTIVVLAPVQGGPAEKAGLKTGDVITKVDGKDYGGDSMSEASNKIKGEEGTKVKLEIQRDGKIMEFEIERQNVKLNHVESKKLEANIGYLKLSTFDEGCGQEFKTKFEDLKKQGITSLIIDLRNNGGGIVEEALEIADLMVDKDQTLLITTDKNGKEEVKKSKADKTINMPIILLTNENSASASEILAGALKDLNAAKIVGTKTYGKGVIQELLTLSDGSGLKITTNEYYTPNHNKINKVGISPDVEVKLPEEEQDKVTVEESKDTQLQKAIEILKAE
ncbi:MAG: S41 family peptidase [Clostridia bacterium]